MSQEAKSFATKTVASLNFDSPSSAKDAVGKVVVDLYTELHARDRAILDLQKEVEELRKAPKVAPTVPALKAYRGPLFTGERDSPDLTEFLQKVRLFSNMNGYTDLQHTKVLLSGLGGTAHKATFMWVDEGHQNATPVEMGAFLKARFEDTTKSDEADRWIQSAQQRGSVRRFNQLFQEKLAQISPSLPAAVALRAYLRALNQDTAKLLWAMKIITLEVAMDTAANLESLDTRDVLTPTTAAPSTRRQTPGRARPSPFQGTPRKLDFNAVQVPTGLTEAQKELWKEGRCIHCQERFKPGHKKTCKAQPRVSEVDMEEEEDVIMNKEIGEYGSFLHRPEIVRRRILRFGRKDRAIKGQLYQRKSPTEPEMVVDLNKEEVWFKRRREASPQYTEEDYENCKKICTSVIEEEVADREVPVGANVNKINFENYLRSCLKDKNPERKNLKVRWLDLEKEKIKKNKKKIIKGIKKEKKILEKQVKAVIKEIKENPIPRIEVRSTEPVKPIQEWLTPKIERSLLIDIEVSGTILTALFDTGSEIDIISERVVQRHKFPLKREKINMNLQGAGADQKPIGKITHSCTLPLQLPFQKAEQWPM